MWNAYLGSFKVGEHWFMEENVSTLLEYSNLMLYRYRIVKYSKTIYWNIDIFFPPFLIPLYISPSCFAAALQLSFVGSQAWSPSGADSQRTQHLDPGNGVGGGGDGGCWINSDKHGTRILNGLDCGCAISTRPVCVASHCCVVLAKEV